jgi:flagellar biosynthesis/type III secretory pathway chaperone
MHSQTAESLHVLFKEMERSIIGMEEIIPLEQVAIGQLDAEGIHKLTEKRKVLWQELKNIKDQCQLLFQQHDVSEESELSVFIDMHLAEDAPALHKQRQELNERILNISNSNELNAIRLRAAAESIAETLQGLGLLKTKSTYGQDGMM